MGTSRRVAIRKGLLGAAGLLGLKAAGPATGAAAAAAAAASGVATRPPPTTLTLYGRHWRSYGQGKRPGALPARGDRLVASGDLHAAPGGDKVGEFHAAVFHLGAPGDVGPAGAGSLELHTFLLPEGSIIGAGAASPDADRHDAFAVIGGTGRYIGARGAYAVRQGHRELGGDGTAEITMQFFTGEV